MWLVLSPLSSAIKTHLTNHINLYYITEIFVVVLWFIEILLKIPPNRYANNIYYTYYDDEFTTRLVYHICIDTSIASFLNRTVQTADHPYLYHPPPLTFRFSVLIIKIIWDNDFDDDRHQIVTSIYEIF